MISNTKKAKNKTYRVIDFLYKRNKRKLGIFGVIDLIHKKYFFKKKISHIYTIGDFSSLIIILLLSVLIFSSNIIQITKNFFSRRKSILLLSFPVTIPKNNNKFLDTRLHHLVNSLGNDFNLIEFVNLNPSLIDGKLFKLIFKSIFTKRIILYSDFFPNIFDNFITLLFNLIPINKKIDFIRSSIILHKFRIYTYKLLLRTLNLNSLFAWEYNHRTNVLIIAANIIGVKTIGAMHGVEMPSYMLNIYYDKYPKKHILDKFFVWNSYWQERHRSSFIAKEYPISSWFIKNLKEIKESSLIKNFNNNKKPSISVIIENLLNDSYLDLYKSPLTKHCDISLKARFKDPNYILKYVSPLQKRIPNSYPIYSFKTPSPDFVIATHSSAVFEYALLGSIPILINTPDWGDYFEIKNDMPNLFFNTFDEFLELIHSEKFSYYIDFFNKERNEILKRIFPLCNNIDILIDSLKS